MFCSMVDVFRRSHINHIHQRHRISRVFQSYHAADSIICDVFFQTSQDIIGATEREQMGLLFVSFYCHTYQFAYAMRQNPTVCFYVICRRLFIASGLTHGYITEHRWQSRSAVLVILSMYAHRDLTRKKANNYRHRLWVEYWLVVPYYTTVNMEMHTHISSSTFVFSTKKWQI